MDKVYDKTKQIVEEYLQLDDGELQPDSHLVEVVGADSLAIIELSFKISEEFSIPMIEHTEKNLIFKNLVSYIKEQIEDTKEGV